MTEHAHVSLKYIALKYGGLTIMYLTLIAVAIKLTILNRPLYVLVLHWLDIPEKVQLPMETILENYDQMMTYLTDRSVENFVLSDFPVSESGAFHFWEVRNLFSLNDLLLVVGGLLTVVFFYFVYHYQLNHWLIQKAKQLLWLPPVVIMLLLIFFDQVFVWFHELAFDNDAWIFNPATDPIINVLPAEYFLACFISVFLLVELGTLLVWLGARLFANHQLNH